MSIPIPPNELPKKQPTELPSLGFVEAKEAQKKAPEFSIPKLLTLLVKKVAGIVGIDLDGKGEKEKKQYEVAHQSTEARLNLVKGMG